MRIICERCGNMCGDLRSKATIERYVKKDFSVKCEYCGENNYYKQDKDK